MIMIVTVWLCLITHVACDVLITVNNNGSDNDKCCVYGTCPCSSLSSALRHVSDNTVINITSESVTLHDIVAMGSGNLNNITITGNGATIICNNIGGVYCELCSDITIMGITWYQCGCKDRRHPVTQIPALAFTISKTSSVIIIQNCTFQNSSGCPVYVQNGKGNILITETNFVGNIFDFVDSGFVDLCAGVYISSDVQIFLAVRHTRFDGNGCTRFASKHDCTYFSVVIKASNNVSESHHFLFESTYFFNNANGVSLYASVRNAVTELLDISMHNNYGSGMHMQMSEGAINYPKCTGIINISSSTFLNSVLVINTGYELLCLSINIDNSTFSDTSNGLFQTGIINIHSYASLTQVTVINSFFYNTLDGVVIIETSNPNDAVPVCIKASIVFENVTVYNTTRSAIFTDSSVQIKTEDTTVSVMFKKVDFMSNHFITQSRGALLVNNHFKNCLSSHPVSIQLINCIFNQNTALDHVVAVNVIVDGRQDVFYIYKVNVEISNCSFDQNIGGKSIVYISILTAIEGLYDDFDDRYIKVILHNLTFSNNKGTALHLITYHIHFKGNIVFIKNSASNGAAVYLEGVYAISSDDNADVQFINNSAEQKGGAMYIDLVNVDTNYCDVFKDISNVSNVSFSNNFAGISGNSIYFNIPQSCQIITDTNNKSSLLYYPTKFKYSQPVNTVDSPIVTSSHNIKLYPPAIAIHNYSENDYIIQQSKMLGEPIQFTASVFDYFNSIAEPVTFSVNCKTCGDDYSLSAYQITVHDHSIHEFKISPRAPSDIVRNTNISLTLLSALLPIYKSLNASLSIELSPCRPGYLFNDVKRQCVCYPYNDLVHCKGNYVEIKIGYWVGFLRENYTSSICPTNYCSSKHSETSPGYYELLRKSDDQCNLHRTGVACSECKPGYTLAYDSPDCINRDKCSVGVTILVVVLTILYWITIVVVVFGLMYFQFQISSGYAYGIIYYYSIVDILLVNNVSEEVFQLVHILSSFAKLTPQLFGHLCLVEGLSGIDQQFIHYSHALAVSVIVLIVVLVTRYSPRLTVFVGRCIIRVICLLLLLSYTSLASTSLQLLRPLTFNNVDEVHTYSSPDIKYLTGRHLVYAIVVILCEVIIVIGLPLFFLFEPFLRQKMNFVRIKPLLDQFQGCYKDRYHWFAAYYLICRQVIIIIVYVGNENYYYMLYALQTTCVIIAIIHGWVQPYKNNFLNGLDETILLILVLVVNLNVFSSLSFIPTNYFSVVLVILPLLLLCFIAIRKLLSYFCNRKIRALCLYNPVEQDEEDDRCNDERR